MIRTMLACVATAALVAGIAASGVFGARSVRTRVTPSCPHASYGADGDMSPLFCVIDNPVALQYFAKEGPHTFALGPNASPGQVVSAVAADRRQAGTIPILCSVYRLAAWREHWSFGISPAQEIGAKLHLYSGWCHDPRFHVKN